MAGLPCLSDKGCPALNARSRLASDEAIDVVERSSLEIEAKGCIGPQADPWTKSLTWKECPGQAAFKRPDIRAFLFVKSLASMSPLSDWPHGYAAHISETWALVERESALMRQARSR